MLITGYELGLMTNEKLETAGLEPIAVQSIYNWMNQGGIDYVIVAGKRRIPLDEAHSWLRHYLATRKSRARLDIIREAFSDIK